MKELRICRDCWEVVDYFTWKAHRIASPHYPPLSNRHEVAAGMLVVLLLVHVKSFELHRTDLTFASFLQSSIALRVPSYHESPKASR